jgi:hypothetical protein
MVVKKPINVIEAGKPISAIYIEGMYHVYYRSDGNTYGSMIIISNETIGGNNELYFHLTNSGIPISKKWSSQYYKVKSDWL